MINIQVTNKKQNQKFEHSGGPLEFGRGPRRNVERFVLNDLFASRDQLRIEELPGQRVRVENLSLKLDLALDDERSISTGATQEFQLPLRLNVGQTRIDIEWLPGGAFEKETLLTIELPMEASESARVFQALDELGEEPTGDVVVQWMEAVISMQRSATGSTEFYQQTAKALVQLVGLDLGMILLRRDWTWEVVARHSGEAVGSIQFSPALLSHVVAERRTFCQDMSKTAVPGKGLQGVDAVVVAPVFGAGDEMVGALYGLRNPRFPARGGKITPLEAQMVQLLAATVGGHLGRAQAARTRVAFEQFFAPKVMRELERDPGLLEGRTQEVTLLVSNLHDFPALSEHLGPQNTCRMVRELLDRHAEKIVENGGVVVEYSGPGVIALWNAPARQHDHALLASSAALAILTDLPEFSNKWLSLTNATLAQSIGLHTATVQVGSMGSGHKFKYGAQGSGLQLALRTQEAARRLGRSLIVTGATADQLPDTFAMRRLGPARFAGFTDPIMLHELHGVSAPPEWQSRRDAYESALELYEAGKWAQASQTLLPLVDPEVPDVPILKLMRQCWEALETSPKPFMPVLDLGDL
ncbi:MAG: adenylate/guanylate cyclase domain-containing protein [Gemmataceae bacterium]|nr:adenylate/guanylate cyclase domain-containing protein [Gemmataceae bacterium]